MGRPEIPQDFMAHADFLLRVEKPSWFFNALQPIRVFCCPFARRKWVLGDSMKTFFRFRDHEAAGLHPITTTPNPPVIDGFQALDLQLSKLFEETDFVKEA